MYIPKDSVNLKDLDFPQIRLGLQGPPGIGKTHSALTFPNVTVLDFDHGLTAYAGKDIIVTPFHDAEWVSKYADGKFARPNINKQPKRKSALLHWLNSEGIKMEKGQTLLLDSSSAIEDAFWHEWTPVYTKKNEIDDYAPWDALIDFFKEIHVLFKSFKCHVIVTYHEASARDKITGALLDKLQPLMQGKFITKVKSYYTDFFRCVTNPVKDDKNKILYRWQVRSNQYFDAKCRLKLPEDVWEVEPHFKIFEQYKNTLSQEL
jgi:AAA domain